MNILDGGNLEISQKFYVAGAPSDRIKLLPGNKVYDRFVGCMKNIKYETDNKIPLTFSKWLKSKTDGERPPRGFQVKGNPEVGCKLSTQKKLSFVTSSSFVKLPSGQLRSGSEQFRSISFSFRTFESDGVLLITSGAYSNTAFFGAELFNGRIYPIIRTPKRVIVPSQPMENNLADGDWHKFKLNIDNDGARITVDNMANTMEYQPSDNLGEFYLGGVDSTQFNTSYVFPYVMRMARAQIGFTGCVKELVRKFSYLP